MFGKQVVMFKKRYVVGNLIIFDQNKRDERQSLTICLTWTTFGIQTIRRRNNNTNYLEIFIHRKTNDIQLWIYRKPIHTDDTIQFFSNHPIENKFAAFKFYIKRRLTLPITKPAKQQEWNIILAIAQNNGFLERIIHEQRRIQ